MSTNILTQEAPSVAEQWSRKLWISLNSFITTANVDMASFPNHNNRLPIIAGKKKTSLCFCELNVPKQNSIWCCFHKDTQRLLNVKLQKQKCKLDCDSMTTAVKCGNIWFSYSLRWLYSLPGILCHLFLVLLLLLFWLLNIATCPLDIKKVKHLLS